MKGAFGKRTWRRTAARRERGMPQRLRQDLDEALALTDDAARRVAVDRVVQGLTDGTYGRAFQRHTEAAARGCRPSDMA